jgi:hypothetical protein
MIYDVFRSQGGETFLIGPPPLNLEPWLHTVVRKAVPAGTAIR